MTTQVRFDYAAFIAELQTLIERAKALLDGKRRAHSDDFKAWRHETLDLIDRINRQRYHVNTNLESRQFRVMSYGATDADDADRFAADLRATIAELELVVARFEKYGDPRERASNQSVPAVTELKETPKPEKITVKWLFAHVPVSLWVSGAVVLGGAFSFGMWAGGTPAGRSVLSFFQPASAVPSTASAAPAPPAQNANPPKGDLFDQLIHGRLGKDAK